MTKAHAQYSWLVSNRASVSTLLKKCGEHLLLSLKVIPDLFLSKEEISQNNCFFHSEEESFGEINRQNKKILWLISTNQCEHKVFQPKILKCFNKHIHFNHETILHQIKKIKTFQKVHFCLRLF